MTGKNMKLKLGIVVLAAGLFMTGCNNQKSFGKLDKTPYATKECIQTMSRGVEIDHGSKIDKIVVYKKKRTLYTYRNGKQIDIFRFSLGKNGDITFGFDVTITNGPGKDFIVFENPFFINSQPGKIFAELMYVEVSTDGINFAKFPSISNTPGPGSIYPNNVTNLAGVWPVYANVGEDGNDMEPDPFNSNEAGGDAFDLDDLVNHPLVQSGDIDLQNINYIKLIDILGDGSNLDSRGSPIYDPTDMDNGAEVDAISVINYI